MAVKEESRSLAEASEELTGLLEKYADVQAQGFSIDLASDHGRWDAFMTAKGYKRYSPNVTTLLFSKEELESHCKVVDISPEDVNNWKQRTMFRYRKGIRDCYRGTEKDPFRR